jgi:hypothetical protein
VAIWDKALSFFVGEAAGAASADVVKPAFEPTRQNAWARRPYRTLDPKAAAESDVRQFDTEQTFTSYREDGREVQHSTWSKSPVDFEDDAKRDGVGPARYSLLKRLATKVPPYGEVLNLWRRERVDEETVDSVLDFEGIPTGLRPALKELVDERLDPETIANAVQQSFVPNAGLLGPIVDGPPFDIPLEQVDLNTLKEFKAAGINFDRAQVMAYLSGNPPSPQELAQMVLRSQISEQTFIHGLREGRTKTKWAKALLHYLTHPILTPSVLVNRRLRGYDDPATFHRRMANHGFTPEQADDWFEASGRPLAPQQMLDLIARKGPSPDGVGVFTFADFKQGMVESDIKPKYSTPAEALYYKYPPLFQLRRAVESGGMTKERARAIMHIERYEPQDIESLLDSWHVSAGAAATHLQRAQTQLWNQAHRSYITGQLPDADAGAALTAAGVPQAEQAGVLQTWAEEANIRRKQLTAAQVKTAFKKARVNAATGQPWTRDEAISQLVSLGYTPLAANDFLNI